jgi:hypothetical protein
MKEVSADKSYLGAENLLATLRKGAIPYIPFKTDSVPHANSYGPKSELWRAHVSLLQSASWGVSTALRKRSNVETTFHMIESKFGQRLRSRTLTAQSTRHFAKSYVITCVS